MKNHLALLINPQEKRFEIVTITDFQSIYDALKCQLIDHTGHQENGDLIFCDDEGLLKPNVGFRIFGQDYPIFGRALLVGTDEEGETAAPLTPFRTIEKLIDFSGDSSCDKAHWV